MKQRMNRRSGTQRHLKQRTTGDVIFDILNYTIFGVFTLACFLPFYYLFINSISSSAAIAKGKVVWHAVDVHFQNYLNIFKLKGIWNSLFITLARTIIGTALNIVGTTFLGYALSKKEFWHRKFWYRFVIITMYFNAGIIPWFVTMKNLKLTNNFLAYILPGIISAYSMILFKTYIESIPASLEESAELDGAGYFVRFTRIILPLCKPIIATLCVFSAVGHWNSFMDTVYLMTDSKLYTLQYQLYQFLNEANALASQIKDGMDASMIDPSKLLTPTSVKMTIAMVVTIPVLLIYPLFQKHFVGGIMVGAVKG